MIKSIEGFDVASGLRIRQFKHGQSNPTYLLEVGGVFRCIESLDLLRSFATPMHSEKY